MVDAIFRPVDSMRIALTLVLVLTVAPAAAQSVTVNSMGVASDGQVLIDPGTGRPRVVAPLLQPWQFGGVKLHAPRKAAAKPAETETASTATEADTAPTPRKHKIAKPAAEAVVSAEPPAKPRRTASATPPAAAPAPASGGFSGFGDLETLTTAPKAAEAPKPAPVAKAQPAAKPVPPPKVVEAPKVIAPKPTPAIEVAKPAPAPKPVKTASIEPTKPHVSAAKPRDSITFAPNASDPSGTAVGSVRGLASSLANALGDGNARIQLMAYAGQRGEKTSDTRRLSLKRALVVRQLLIDDGIPAERIDVFALGGVDDSGPLDRVDVLIKG
jgi:outer membrane protein OmpA-like peptidoglycan-associated protein